MMRYVDEYRSAEAVQQMARAIRALPGPRAQVMEVCGGQTHTILKYGLEALIEERVCLIHGPGCPVCVTPVERLDLALEIARRPEVIFTSFGDMLRVPGSRESLFDCKAAGADVRMLYSPLDALKLAAAHPDRQVVFFAVGFETTAPTTAMAAYRAHQLGLKNFSLLVAHVLVPPAMQALLADPETRIDGFLAAGHVCSVAGCQAYQPLAERFRVPMAVTGFEPLDLMDGIYTVVKAVSEGHYGVDNRYPRAVRWEGNPVAQALLDQVFEAVDQEWRGFGVLPASGYRLRPEFAHLDAELRFPRQAPAGACDARCLAGQVLAGKLKPDQCPHFGIACHPGSPLGAPMVSAEGACAAYFNYARVR